MRREKRMYPKGKPKLVTALDRLLSLDSDNSNKSTEHPRASGLADVNEESDSSGKGTRFAGRTGIFEVDFPSAPNLPKHKGKGKSSSPIATTTVPTRLPVESTTSEEEASATLDNTIRPDNNESTGENTDINVVDSISSDNLETSYQTNNVTLRRK